MDVTNQELAGLLPGTVEELRRQASKDSLTGLLNRGTMEKYIRERLQSMDQGDHCALLIVDLDNFKTVNDTLGHQAGDLAICKAAQILSGLFGPRDIVGRLGGDEFAVFLCGALTEEQAAGKASQVCGQLQLALGDSSQVGLTASVGVYFTGPGQEFDGLYQTADLALYKAKRAGKHTYYLKSTQGGFRQGEQGAFQPVNAIPLNGLLENMGSGVALVELGEAAQVIYISPSYCRLLQVEAPGFPVPRPLAGMVHPDDLVALEEALRGSVARGIPAENTHRVRAKGEDRWLWVQCRACQVAYDVPNPVVLLTCTDVSRYKENQQRLEEANRRLRAAFSQTSLRLWEVDVPRKEFHSFRSDGSPVKLGAHNHFPGHLIDGGWVHPSSAPRFRAFAQELLSGSGQGFGNFAVRDRRTGYYSWASASYRMLYDEVGRAVRAVGVLEDLPRSVMAGSAWGAGQSPLPEGLLADLMVRIRVNLDADAVETLWDEGRNLDARGKACKASAILSHERGKFFSPEDAPDFRELLDRARLLQLFREGRRWQSAEYRRVDSGGSIRWVRHVLLMGEDPVFHQVYLFGYILRADLCHQLAQEAGCPLERDPATGLYTPGTARQLAEAMLADGAPGNRGAAVVQVMGLEGHPAPHRARREIAIALSLTLGGNCVMCQYAADQVMAVFPAVTSQEEMRSRLENAVAFLRRTLPSEDPAYASLRFVVGAAMLPSREAHYALLVGQALHTCAGRWDAAVDTVAFAQEDTSWDWSSLSLSDQRDQVLVGQEEPPALSDGEKDAALTSLSAMLTARSLDASLLGVLETIGVYYRADRAYTLMLVENQQAVVMTFEWASPGKRSIQQAVSGSRLDRFPLLERCLKERKPMFLTRGGQGEGAPAPGELWHYTVFPLSSGEQVWGFLCVENAREHPTDVALFSTLIPYMLAERDRFSSGKSPVRGGADRLMGMPDLRDYMQTVYTLTSQRFSSLGAVCLDVPALANLNSRMGFEYGSKLLWYAAKTLTEVFDASLLFRTWDAEFVAFLPNTTREVFLGRVARLRSILQRRYPKQIRVGRAWAEGSFTAVRLVKEAKGAMMAEVTQVPEQARPLVENDYASVGEAASAGRFTVYYQPKIDMRTGAMVGAEALVRGVEEDGAIIPPGQFIEYLEENGSVRELDLFVLEQALLQAERWRQAGWGVVPISVNLSRVTMVQPTTLASVLAVQSRVPQIPPEALELEVTERGGIEDADFRTAIDQFSQNGLHLSLDDFGSKYANLSLFSNARFTTIKLDRSLIEGLAANEISRTLVRDIIQICRTYGKTCVAEGVSSREQADALLEMGCVYCQGFYFDKPMPPAAFEEKYLRRQAKQAHSKEED